MKLEEGTIAELKAKFGDIYKVECDLGMVVHRHPSQAEIDAYLLGTVRGTTQESANNLVFSCRVWPEAGVVAKMFDEAPAVVTKFAEEISEVAGADTDDILGLQPRDLDSASDEERTGIEARAGKTFDAIRNEHPRGCLRLVTLPFVGPSIFRRPTRSTYAAFLDASKTDEVMNAARTMCAECAITDEKALPEVFSKKPAVSFFLAFALGALAGAHLEVRSGKL